MCLLAILISAQLGSPGALLVSSGLEGGHREREGARTQSSSFSDLVRSDLLLFLPLEICNGSSRQNAVAG